MNIMIFVNKYFDWEPIDKNQVPSQEDVLAMKYKPAMDGSWLKKIEKQQETYTQINLPESEIQDCFAHFERIGRPKSRERLVAWYLEEQIMAHHAPISSWTNIEVAGEPEVESFLKTYFEVK